VDHAIFDKRRYPIVEVSEGYREWVHTYEQTVQDEMDLRLLDRLQTVDWFTPRCVLDLACGTGRVADFNRFFDQQMARLAEPSRDRFLHFMMLVDDLAVIADRAGTLQVGKLQDTDGEVRCAAADVVLELRGGLHAVLPLLDDTEDWVRWHVTGLLARYGDDSVVEPLIAKLRLDPDPAVRGQAAFAGVAAGQAEVR
jgi:hypothetical protein